MKKNGVLVVIVVLLMCLLLAGCESIPVPPVDTADDLAQLIENDMTLTQVYDLMTSQLKDAAIEYPAIDIKQKEDGSWAFTGQEGGIAEDTDAPCLAMIWEPEDITTEYYIIFLKNEVVIGSGWFPYQSAATIQKTLEGTLTAD